jgi:hypothetical protein
MLSFAAAEGQVSTLPLFNVPCPAFVFLALSSLFSFGAHSSLFLSRLAMLAASCPPNGAKVRNLILLLQHLSIDVSFAGPEHFQLGRDSFMMQVLFLNTLAAAAYEKFLRCDDAFCM